MSVSSSPVRVSRALLSASDKTGLVEAAQKLVSLGVEILSTGGTAKALKDADVPVTDVSDVTGFPEIMDGRVKTLHPNIHGGILARRDLDTHLSAMTEHGIGAIDLVYVTLYPFEETLAKGSDYDACVENIDIGGPAMIRAAAKNHAFVAVCVDATDLGELVAELADNDGQIGFERRRALAAKAFARVSAYDAAISGWMFRETNEEAPLWRSFGGSLIQPLRYGENPHQSAGLYGDGSKRPGAALARQLQGKELSYNNINDTDAAFEAVAEFDPRLSAAVVIVKHANPCGVAVGADLVTAYTRALACDPVSAFGGIVAVNRKLDATSAREITKIFTEVVIAPDADEAAIAIFAAKKNLRLLLTGGLPDPLASGLTFKTVAGGFLVQGRDNRRIEAADLKVVTKRAPSARELEDLLFAFRVGKHVKSNAIVYARDLATVGIGAGQMSRVDSARIAAIKAKDSAKAAGLEHPLTEGSVCASDAFFPFADGLLAAAAAGATAIIQPGGSIRDDEVIKAADEVDLAMVFTGVRHFRH